MAYFVEYVWLDQDGGLRHKTRILPTQGTFSFRTHRVLEIDENGATPTGTEAAFPRWSYDGSSTGQAEPQNSDLFLVPVYAINCSVYHKGGYVVLCEVFNSDMTPHESNTRAPLREVLANGGEELKPWFGFEQEYFFMKDGRPLGWPTNPEHWPAPQGDYYCGINCGSELYEAHLEACLASGISVFGGNHEVSNSQFEWQIGPNADTAPDVFALEAADQLWLSRWILRRIAWQEGCTVDITPKPIKGDINGSGCHLGVSTAEFRSPDGVEAMKDFFETTLKTRHMEHMAEYGEDNDQRMTGLHETSAYNQFSHGVRDRTRSIRIPAGVEEAGHGYFEDRRPAGNADPYRVGTVMLESILSWASVPITV